MTVDAPPMRRYRGSPPDERRAERRCRLIRAAIEVYGKRGYRRATVKAVCAAAGLTERYFYESFVNSEMLLAACYDAVTRELFNDISGAGAAAGRSRTARVRAMLRAYFDTLKREPRSARVFLVEIRGVSPAVDQAFEASLRHFGRALAQALSPAVNPAATSAATSAGAAARAASDELLQTGVVGGVIHIAQSWITDGYTPSVDEVTAAALRLCRVLTRSPD
jgi:AcrR family transcriptional regulator